MIRFRLRLLIVSSLVMIVVVGCRNSTDGPSAGGDFNGRLQAAKAISNTSSKDEALAKLAIDAAVHGESDIVKQAVGSISNTSTKDDAAFKAALRLAKAGKGDDATAVAKMINNTSERDAALGKLAKGDF